MDEELLRQRWQALQEERLQQGLLGSSGAQESPAQAMPDASAAFLQQAASRNQQAIGNMQQQAAQTQALAQAGAGLREQQNAQTQAAASAAAQGLASQQQRDAQNQQMAFRLAMAIFGGGGGE